MLNEAKSKVCYEFSGPQIKSKPIFSFRFVSKVYIHTPQKI